jgi:hypothetical protein
MELGLVLLRILHFAIYLFVFFAFLTKETAFVNLYGTIPVIFFSQIFPFCSLQEIKRRLYPQYKQNIKEVYDQLLYTNPITKPYINMYDYLEKYTYKNPIGAQGILVLGAITSAYRLQGDIKLKVPLSLPVTLLAILIIIPCLASLITKIPSFDNPGKSKI